jgi:hypothetical protein
MNAPVPGIRCVERGVLGGMRRQPHLGSQHNGGLVSLRREYLGQWAGRECHMEV